MSLFLDAPPVPAMPGDGSVPTPVAAPAPDDRDPADALAERAYEHVVVDAIVNHPRTLQTRIGPSELGLPCERRLLVRLAGEREPDRGIAWKPTIGTAMHAWLEDAFDAANQGSVSSTWVTEERLSVGAVDGVDITGSSDLFHVPTGTVIDHKLVGTSMLSKYRTHGPSEQYRYQAHLYGLGFLRHGGWGTPHRVAISFLPREAEWSKRYWWSEPWNPALAVEALSRANRLHTELTEQGLEQAQARYALCEDRWCPTCRDLAGQARGDVSLFLQ
ncbi:MAG: hypothetical protein ACTH31_08900 [Pseudoclavibacter sp.]